MFLQRTAAICCRRIDRELRAKGIEMSIVNAETDSASHKTANNGQTPPPRSFEGKLVSMTGNHLVITNAEGIKLPLSLAKDAQVTCEGTACTTEVLRIGERVLVTTQWDHLNLVTGIAILDRNDGIPK
jgi:hypothetical protein